MNVIIGLLFAAYVISIRESKHIPEWIKQKMIKNRINRIDVL